MKDSASVQSPAKTAGSCPISLISRGCCMRGGLGAGPGPPGGPPPSPSSPPPPQPSPGGGGAGDLALGGPKKGGGGVPPLLVVVYGYYFEKTRQVLDHKDIFFYGRYIDDCIAIVYAESK